MLNYIKKIHYTTPIQLRKPTKKKRSVNKRFGKLMLRLKKGKMNYSETYKRIIKKKYKKVTYLRIAAPKATKVKKRS